MRYEISLLCDKVIGDHTISQSFIRTVEASDLDEAVSMVVEKAREEYPNRLIRLVYTVEVK